MITSRYLTIIAAVVLALAVGFTAVFTANPALLGITASETGPEYEEKLFGGDVVSIDIRVDEADWADMLENATQEEYIPCDVIVNGTTFATVGIRPKGNSSLTMVAQDDTTDRYSFKFEFDHYITGQTCFGLDKLVINNIQSDSTYMKEYLSYDLLSYIGVDTPFYTYASVTVNGEDWGFYLAVEALEEAFAQRVFGSDYGMLYKPESMGQRGEGRMQEFIENNAGGGNEAPQENPGDNSQGRGNGFGGQNGAGQGGFGGNQPDGMVGGGGMGGFGSSGGGSDLQYTDDDPDSYSSIFENSVFDSTATDQSRVIEALKNLSDGTELEKYINVDQVLRYFAANTVLVNLDSYQGTMQHNYYLYEKDGQLSILPWDYNLSFAGFQSGDSSSAVNFPIDTPVSGVELSSRPLLAKLLEVEEYKELYHQYLNEIVEGYFQSGYFEEQIDRLDAAISDYVKNDASAFVTYEQYTQSLPMLREFGRLRALSVKGQLAGDIPSTTDGQSQNPGALVDASTLNLSLLGSQGGGMNRENEAGAFGGGQFGGRGGGAAQQNGGDGQNTPAQPSASGENDVPNAQNGGQNKAGQAPSAGGNAPQQNSGDGQGGPPASGTGEQGGNAFPGGADMPDMQVMRQAMEILASADGESLTEEQMTQLSGLGLSEEQIEQLTQMTQGGGGGFGGMQMPGGEQNGGRPAFGQASGGSAAPAGSSWSQGLPVLLASGGALIVGLLFVILFRRRRYTR